MNIINEIWANYSLIDKLVLIAILGGIVYAINSFVCDWKNRKYRKIEKTK
ncbi:MAG: hypothetical protein FWG18_02375 [Alphaproteobacteria bacterium]|nr:hypothetical protein [Alphaproteobacteria bacterium]